MLLGLFYFHLQLLIRNYLFVCNGQCRIFYWRCFDGPWIFLNEICNVLYILCRFIFLNFVGLNCRVSENLLQLLKRLSHPFEISEDSSLVISHFLSINYAFNRRVFHRFRIHYFVVNLDLSVEFRYLLFLLFIFELPYVPFLTLVRCTLLLILWWSTHRNFILLRWLMLIILWLFFAWIWRYSLWSLLDSPQNYLLLLIKGILNFFLDWLLKVLIDRLLVVSMLVFLISFFGLLFFGYLKWWWGFLRVLVFRWEFFVLNFLRGLLDFLGALVSIKLRLPRFLGHFY